MYYTDQGYYKSRNNSISLARLLLLYCLYFLIQEHTNSEIICCSMQNNIMIDTGISSLVFTIHCSISQLVVLYSEAVCSSSLLITNHALLYFPHCQGPCATLYGDWPGALAGLGSSMMITPTPPCSWVWGHIWKTGTLWWWGVLSWASFHDLCCSSPTMSLAGSGSLPLLRQAMWDRGVGITLCLCRLQEALWRHLLRTKAKMSVSAGAWKTGELNSKRRYK